VRLSSGRSCICSCRSAGVDEALVGAAIIAIDKLDKETPDAVRAELVEKGVSEAAAGALLDDWTAARDADAERLLAAVTARTGAAGAPHVAQLRQILALTPPLPSGRLVFDPFLARGMDYYTGPIFEVAADGIPFSLAGGGRFDDLVERLAGVKVPACGFSIGFERVCTLMEERGLFGGAQRAADVLIVLPSDDVTAEALQLATELRKAGVRVDVFPHAAKLPAQYEVAERKRIPYAIVADAEKLRAAALEIRDLAARKQHGRAARRGRRVAPRAALAQDTERSALARSDAVRRCWASTRFASR
jgi:histidyl-tRNA synthetase